MKKINLTMKKLFYTIIITIFSQLNVFTQTSFPLEIGNKWYYQGVSSRYGYRYGIVKEITDTTSNGFREILFRYVYEDSISIGTESWAYIDGKFYNK